MSTSGHKGAEFSFPISSARDDSGRADSAFNKLRPELQAVLKGSVQALDMMLTIKLLARDGSLGNLQFITEHKNIFSLYHDALMSCQEPEVGVFRHAWETFKEQYPTAYSDLYDLNVKDNSVDHLLTRGAADIAIAWANEEMNNAILFELSKLLYAGFKNTQRQPEAEQMLKLCVLLKRLSNEKQHKKVRHIFLKYLEENTGASFITPMFSPEHAAYVTIQPSTSRNGLFRITVCNGGHAAELFAMRRFTHRPEYELNFRGHCVILADFDHTKRLFELLGYYWMDEKVFSKVAEFIRGSVVNECARWGAQFFSSGRFIQLDELELAKGQTKELPGLSIKLGTQYQGNCTVFNLILALAMCSIDDHLQASVKCQPIGAAGYKIAAVQCKEFIKHRATLEPVIGVRPFRAILLSLVRHIVQYDRLCNDCPYLGHTIYERDNHKVTMENSDPGLYCIGPRGEIVTGEKPEGGWNNGADSTLSPLSRSSPLLQLIVDDLEGRYRY